MLSDLSWGNAAKNIAAKFLGNSEAVNTLGRMIDSGRIPHAFIVEGEDGLGKSTFARIIARGAMCECTNLMEGSCPHCRKLNQDIHPDLIYVKGSGKLNAISIDTVRDMRRDSQTAPNEAERRVFLLEDCDNMLPPAQNAFLKIFEEAPPHVVFIITCRSAMNLLETIRSRGFIITLHPVEPSVGAEYIHRLHPEIDERKALELCEKSGGNIGEALRMISVGSGDFYADADKISVGIINAACFGSELELAAECSKIGKDRSLGKAVCDRLSETIRRSLMISVGAENTVESPSQQELTLGRGRTEETLLQYLSELNNLSESLKINISMPLFNTRLAIILQRR